LLDLYTKSVGRNAVLLINVPPDQRGLIHEQDAQTLAAFGTAVQRRFGQSLAETSGTGNDLLLSLTNSATIDRAILMEDIRQGERVDRFVVEGLGNTSTNWQELAKGQIIGHKRILEFPPVEVAHVRLRLLKSAAPPIIRRFAVFSAFPLPKAP
jgi:alpha-L-fucosidase